MNGMPLRLAMFCVCQYLYRRDQWAVCPACGSEMAVPLETWLPAEERVGA